MVCLSTFLLYLIIIFSDHQAAIHSVMGQLDNKVMKGAVNETSDGKVLKIVKGILVGLEDNEKAITNLVCNE